RESSFFRTDVDPRLRGGDDNSDSSLSPFDRDKPSAVIGHNLPSRRDHQEFLLVPDPIHQSLEQAEVSDHFLELPAALGSFFSSLALEAPVRPQAHINVSELAVILSQVAQLAPQILGIVFAVAGHKVFVVLTDAQYFPHGKLAELAVRLAALHPSSRHEVDTWVVVEVIQVTLGAAEEKGDAIVGARNNKGIFARSQPYHTIVAEAIPEQHGLVPGVVHTRERGLQALSHALAADVVQSLRKELHIHSVRGTRHDRAKLPVEDLASNQLQPHKGSYGARASYPPERRRLTRRDPGHPFAPLRAGSPAPSCASTAATMDLLAREPISFLPAGAGRSRYSGRDARAPSERRPAPKK